ncbi:DUF6907 domain-containing protein [Streptomyces sp. NPDC055078]
MKLKPTTPEITSGHTVPPLDLTPSGRPHPIVDTVATPAETVAGPLSVPASCTRYAWCSECRTYRYDDGEPYVEHGSHTVRAPIPAGLEVERGELLSAVVGSDESHLNERPQLYIGHGGNGTDMDTANARVWLAGMRAYFDEVERLADMIDGTAPVSPRGSAALTAAERGPEWTARYNCTPTCILNHAGEDGEPGWHQGPAVEIMAPGLSSNQLPGELPVPLLSARITTANDEPDVFGVKTELWVETESDTLELSLDKTDTLIESLEQALPRLRVLREQLAEESKNDRPRNPEAVAEVHARWDAERDAERAEILKAAEATAEAHA